MSTQPILQVDAKRYKFHNQKAKLHFSFDTSTVAIKAKLYSLLLERLYDIFDN